MMNKVISLVFGCLILLVTSIAQATITNIDLNDFFADPSVTVAADGSWATLTEDPIFSPTVLQNDPGLGDPEVIHPGVGVSLLFDFDFMEGFNDDDEFHAYILNASTGTSVTGYEFDVTSSSLGTVAFDLSSLTALTLGLHFELQSNDSSFDSMVTVSNVRLVTAEVPEPSLLALLSIGLIGIGLIRKCK